MSRPFSMLIVSMLLTFFLIQVVDAQLQGLPFRNKAKQQEQLELAQKHGPFLIMCASFVDETGLQQAKALVQELRQEYQMNAYIYGQHFDFSATVAGRDWQSFETETGEESFRLRRMKAANSSPFTEYAVVVGNFPSMEDAQAQKTLEKIKYIKPDALTVSETVTTNQRLGVWREIQRRISPNSATKEKGPMRAAFVMANPTLPEEYFNQPGLDEFVLKMNKKAQYSLLDCPEAYTVRVATFRGDSTFESSEMETVKRDMEQRRRFNQPITESKLAEAFAKANTLAKELRKNGIEAYEFHDRNESFVCVGSYPWATRKMANGKDELNPDIAKVIKKFKARVDSIGGMQGAVRPKSIPSLAGKGIFFDIQPIPVMVPQVPQRGTLSRR